MSTAQTTADKYARAEMAGNLFVERLIKHNRTMYGDDLEAVYLAEVAANPLPGETAQSVAADVAALGNVSDTTDHR